MNFFRQGKLRIRNNYSLFTDEVDVNHWFVLCKCFIVKFFVLHAFAEIYVHYIVKTAAACSCMLTQLYEIHISHLLCLV